MGKGDGGLRTSGDKEGSSDVGNSSMSGVCTRSLLKGSSQLPGHHDASKGLRDSDEKVQVRV